MLSRALHHTSHLLPLRSPYTPAGTLLLRTLTTTPHSPNALSPRLTILESDILESFLKGSGPGGQKINKTASAVQLKHLPTGIVVKCQHTRSRSQNRKMARRLLAERVEEMELGEESRGAMKRREMGRKKRAAGKKKRRKYRALEEMKRGMQGEGDGMLGGGVLAAVEHGVEMAGEEEGSGGLRVTRRRGKGAGDVKGGRDGLGLVDDQDEEHEEDEEEEDDEDEEEEDDDEDDDEEDDDEREGFDLASPGRLFEIASPAPSVRKFVDNLQDPQFMALVMPSTGRQEVLVKGTVGNGVEGWVKPDRSLSLKLFPFDTNTPPLNIVYTPDD
ncbi:hypothetical protein H2199_005046 [Coniosporium tulheliwenetii]|uniref:Uncharacterized protein n=1 Tax=Coniosporium tulheliwenetii TaxID=3383036 RepID=A0ACC2Z2M0_9PEZI|nr:hypothetical protein H2199_005046 [Cladosporium sp. JES 115]